MDPLSVVAGVVGITSVAVQSSKALCELIDGVRSAPDEIKNISRDTHAFYSILFSLESSLRDPRVTAVIAEDEPLTALLENLREPLGNCTSLLGQLLVKIQRFVRPLDGERWRMSSNDLKWYFGKKELLDLMARVEVTKSTLNTGLTAVGTLCNVRIVAVGIVAPGKPLRRGSNDTDAGFALRRFVEEKDRASQYASSIAPPSPPLDAFNAGMRLGTDTTLQGSELRPSIKAVDKIERLKRAENQRNALIQAARQGDSLLVEVTIEEGADVNAKGPDGKGAMHEAAIEGHSDIVQLLIDRKADVNIKQTPRGDAVKRKFHGLRTPLHWAADRGYDDVARLLLDNGADINAKNTTDRTPLQESISSHNTSVAKLLLDRGASVSIHDDEGWTPLHQAAYSGNVELINILVDKVCDTEARTFENSIWSQSTTRLATPLFLAASTGQEAAVRALLARDADPRSRNINGELPIHIASWRGWAPVVRIMLDAGIDIEERDVRCEQTPLLMAASTGQTGVLKLLLERGADMDAVTQSGRNALKHAQLHRKEGNEEAVSFLQEAYRKREELSSNALNSPPGSGQRGAAGT
ncbi:MAG: hypothetical protein Q9213_004005 [Squamulea squamosa]